MAIIYGGKNTSAQSQSTAVCVMTRLSPVESQVKFRYLLRRTHGDAENVSKKKNKSHLCSHTRSVLLHKHRAFPHRETRFALH